MKRTLVFLVLVPSIILAGPTNAYAQSVTFTAPLIELKQLGIVVEEMGPIESKFGLREDDIEEWVLVALRRDIPNLKIDKASVSYVYVNINFLEFKTVGGRGLGLSGQISLSIIRPTIIVSDDREKKFGYHFSTIWGKSLIQIGPATSFRKLVQDGLETLLKKFAADYYRQNP